MENSQISKLFFRAFYVCLYIFVIISVVYYIKTNVYKNNFQYSISEYIENIIKSYLMGDTKYITDLFDGTKKPTKKNIEEKKLEITNIDELDIQKELEIGGLDTEVKEIIKKSFLTRDVKYKAMCKDISFNHVKGIILYGSPGTGKTLIARKLSKNILKCTTLQVVNGPELLDKWIGSSEKNIRDLFENAERGSDDELHVIIFDEIDAICRKRSTLDDAGSKCQSNIVNTLLSKMDGYDRLNNILIIGTTNKIDVIDKAFLRPGRFEIQLNIKKPDFKGREEIFKIHLNKAIEKGYFNLHCDYFELASITDNYSGADIEGLVKKVISKKMIDDNMEKNIYIEDFKENLF